MSCFDLTHAPVATAARAAATGLVSMSNRPDLEGSGTVEIATRRCFRLRVVWDLRELTHSQKPRLLSLPARAGPVTVYPTRWGVVPRATSQQWVKVRITTIDSFVLLVAVVNVGKFYFLKAGNTYFNQVVFCRSLEWIVSLKKNKKVYTTIESNYGRYNRVVYSCSFCQLLMLAGFTFFSICK